METDEYIYQLIKLQAFQEGIHIIQLLIFIQNLVYWEIFTPLYLQLSLCSSDDRTARRLNEFRRKKGNSVVA
jgi:hypothetical protein